MSLGFGNIYSDILMKLLYSCCDNIHIESAPATRIIVYSVFTLTALLNDKNVGLGQ